MNVHDGLTRSLATRDSAGLGTCLPPFLLDNPAPSLNETVFLITGQPTHSVVSQMVKIRNKKTLLLAVLKSVKRNYLYQRIEVLHMAVILELKLFTGAPSLICHNSFS